MTPAGSTGYEVGKSYCEVNLGAGAVTITPVTSTVNGQSSIQLAQGQSTCPISDGTNWVSLSGTGSSIATPVSVANGGTGLASGTSGGVLAYTATGTLASSAALTANAPVIGGGPGAAPSSGTRSGNTTSFATTSGALTSGHCVSIDANSNLVDAGGACTTGGGGGTVSSGTSGYAAYYTGTGTVVGSTSGLLFNSTNILS